MRNYYEPGQWNVVCSRCGFKRKNVNLRAEWTGLMVCADTCWEPRHPQTLIQVDQERISVPWTSPEPDDVFLFTDDYWTTEKGETIVNEFELPLST